MCSSRNSLTDEIIAVAVRCGQFTVPSVSPHSQATHPKLLVVAGTVAVCSLLMNWTLSSLDKNLADTVVTRAEATLVTHVLYRWVRQPFYLTVALLMASVTLLTANWIIGVSCVLVLELLHLHAQGMARTGRFLPRLRSCRTFPSSAMSLLQPQDQEGSRGMLNHDHDDHSFQTDAQAPARILLRNKDARQERLFPVWQRQGLQTLLPQVRLVLTA